MFCRKTHVCFVHVCARCDPSLFFYRNCHLTITERRSAYNCIFLERSLHLEFSLWCKHTNCDKYMLLFLLQKKNNHRNIFTTSTDNEDTYKLLSTRESPEQLSHSLKTTICSWKFSSIDGFQSDFYLLIQKVHTIPKS